MHIFHSKQIPSNLFLWPWQEFEAGRRLLYGQTDVIVEINRQIPIIEQRRLFRLPSLFDCCKKWENKRKANTYQWLSQGSDKKASNSHLCLAYSMISLDAYVHIYITISSNMSDHLGSNQRSGFAVPDGPKGSWPPRFFQIP